MKLKCLMWRSWLAISGPFRRTVVATACGHDTKRVGIVSAFGEAVTMSLPERPEHCLSCLGRMAIRCAWCGRTIHIGSPITLRVGCWEATSSYPEHAVRWPEDPKRVVGCLRMDCSDTGGDRAGFWMPPGIVRRMPTIFQLMMAAGPGKIAIVGDQTDPRDLGKIVALRPTSNCDYDSDGEMP